MNKAILHKEVQEFIRNYTGDMSKLAFAGSPFGEITIKELLQQIEGRRRIEKKLPAWYKLPGVLYPPKLNLEQTSSESTAKYKASLISGETLADLTGGFGVDSYYFSKNHKTVHHFEINESLSKIAVHNFKKLTANNIVCIPKNGLEFIKNEKYNNIYIDPSRRHNTKGKIFYLKDCEPNILENLEYLLDRCEILLLKTSPMLDISLGIEELKYVNEVHIIAVENDVKELVWVLKRHNNDPIQLKTINFAKNGPETFDFCRNDPASVTYSVPKQFLYEPNTAILKSGAFGLLSDTYAVDKLHKNTHLYTNEELQKFPGRRFQIENTVPYSKKEIRKALSFDKANITVRNFPESVAKLRKYWKIKEGGDVYLFFTTIKNDQKVMLVCKKV